MRDTCRRKGKLLLLRWLVCFISVLRAGNAWTDLFINLSGADFDMEEELMECLSANGPRLFLLGGDFIPDGSNKDALDPELGTRPGGFTPHNEADLCNARTMQAQERVILSC